MKRNGVNLFILLTISFLVVWPAFGTSARLGVKAQAPVWMGAVDGLVLAKARFLRGGLGLGTWNRYWFLGIPGQHIGSPVLPLILSLFPLDDPVLLFRVWRGIVAIGVMGSVFGAYLFARELSREKRPFSAIFVSLFILLIPSVLVIFPQIWSVVRAFGWPSWLLFSAFFLGEGQQVIGFGFVLALLGLSWRLIEAWSIRRAAVLAFLVAFLLVVDSLSFLTMILWLAVLLLTRMVRPSLNQKSLLVSLRLLSVCIFGFLLTCFWFTPGFLLTFVRAPSLGGQPLTTVMIGLLRRFLVVLPAILGVIVARRWFRRSSLLVVVGTMGLLVFGSLTLAAFIADPDFWQDYSRFGRSLDLSLGLVIGGFLQKGNLGLAKRFLVLVVIGFFALPFLIVRDRLLLGTLQFSQTAEYRVGKALSQVVARDCRSSSGCFPRAYLSGSSVFWLNSWSDVAQVRGGGEQGSLNSWWPHGSYQIREGSDPELSDLWLRALGVSYLVVHGRVSSEVYHDFRFPEKFATMDGWEKVWEDRGDAIYRRTKGGIAEIVNLGILALSPPKKGDDAVGLQRYVGMFKGPVSLVWMGKKEVTVSAQVGEGEGIRLAIAASPFWRVVDSSVPVEVRRDPLGMLVVRPKEKGVLAVRLRYKAFPDIIGGMLMTILAIFVLIRWPIFIERGVEFVERFLGRESELDRTAL